MDKDIIKQLITAVTVIIVSGMFIFGEYSPSNDESEYIPTEEIMPTKLYFIDNGYYYHKDKNCKGLEGYTNLNITGYDDLIEYPELDACNWCITQN